VQRTGEVGLAGKLIKGGEIGVITTGHNKLVDYQLVSKHAKAIFDTKNVMKNIKNRKNIEVL